MNFYLKYFWAKFKNRIIILIIALFILDIVIYYHIFYINYFNHLNIFFLNVGQGDSELIILPGYKKILIDGGPDNTVLMELEKILPPLDRYIDVVILTHPQLDHFGGLIEVVNRYKIGAFIYNGQNRDMIAYKYLINLLEKNKIQKINIMAGDKIIYQNNLFNVLSPSKDFLFNSDLNYGAIVLLLNSDNIQTLFTSDINSDIESKIKNLIGSIDILKVAHHGSKYSSSLEFLQTTHPKISVIEVGKNSYGHPSNKVIDNLQELGSKVFRTDFDGTIKITANNLNKLIINKIK
ncbi:MAG: ComEC/Rec2 family competence protein [Minisyncoccia bacterium]